MAILNNRDDQDNVWDNCRKGQHRMALLQSTVRRRLGALRRGKIYHISRAGRGKTLQFQNPNVNFCHGNQLWQQCRAPQLQIHRCSAGGLSAWEPEDGPGSATKLPHPCPVLLQVIKTDCLSLADTQVQREVNDAS